MKKWLFLFLACCISLISHANPLPSAQVFQVNATKIDPNTFAINFQVKPDYFLYSDRIKLTPTADSAIHLGSIRFPATSKKVDKQGHVYTVYRNHVSIPVAILGNKPGKTRLSLNYQGCADDGFCYAPEQKSIQLVIDDKLALSQVSIEATAPRPEPTTPAATATNNGISKVFINHSWAMILLTF